MRNPARPAARGVGARALAAGAGGGAAARARGGGREGMGDGEGGQRLGLKEGGGGGGFAGRPNLLVRAIRWLAGWPWWVAAGWARPAGFLLLPNEKLTTSSAC